MKSYGQYCPIARTSELFAERWTPILIRNLLAGCRTFSELQQGAPGISRALLAQRLDLLERHAVVIKDRSSANRCSYTLTAKGSELKDVTDAMGRWGARWLEVEPHHVDPAYVLWATCKLVDLERLPARGLIVRVEFTDRPAERLWMVLRRPRAEMCNTDLGWEEDVILRTDATTLAHWNLRHLTTTEAQRSGRLELLGPPTAVKRFLAALRPSPFAGTQPADEHSGVHS
jgi:DNA-binding HxlR family transcriptional regulator